MRKILLICLAWLLASQAHSKSLTVVSWGGPLLNAQQTIYFQPFTRSSKIEVDVQSRVGGIAEIRKKAEADQWDVVLVDAEELLAGCKEEIYEKLTWAVLGGSERFLKGAVQECGVGAIVYGTVLGYDADRFASAPASWQDFWNFKKYPGKRALQRGPKLNLEIALLADGVKPEDVYPTLSTPEGVERAFKKLNALRPYLSWWDKGAQPMQWLASGKVVMASTYNTRLVWARKAENRNYQIAWANPLYTMDFWTILKTSEKKAQAEKLLGFMSTPEAQKNLAIELPYGPTRKEVPKLLKPALLADLPSNPDYLKNAVYIDESFWMENLPQLTQRFNQWAASK